MFWKSFKHGNSWYQFIRFLECISCNFTVKFTDDDLTSFLAPMVPRSPERTKFSAYQQVKNLSHGPRVQRSAESSTELIHPGRLTAGTQSHEGLVQMISLFKQVPFRFHVNFPGCTTYLTGKTWWCSVMSHITKFSNWTFWPLPTFTETKSPHDLWKIWTPLPSHIRVLGTAEILEFIHVGWRWSWFSRYHWCERCKLEPLDKIRGTIPDNWAGFKLYVLDET